MKAAVRWAVLAAMAAGSLAAQFAFFPADSDTRIDAQFSLGTIAAGDSIDALLRVKNVGAEQATLSILAIAGDRFELVNPPPLPRVMAAGAALGVIVRFRPDATGSYSAGLRAGDSSILLMAAAAPAPTLLVEENGAWRALAPSTPVDFGSVERESTARLHVELRNQTAQELDAPVTVEGTGFRLDTAVPTRLKLAPGTSYAFYLAFRASISERYEGWLRIGLLRFPLRATTVEPPLPALELLVVAPRAESAQQGRVQVRLAVASRTRAEGELRMEFIPAAATGPDPTVIFSTGSRSSSVRVEEGENLARFGTVTTLEFQTGSTAGEIRFTLAIRDITVSKSVVIPPEPVMINSVSAARGTSLLEVQVRGLDNTRSISTLTFTFYDREGHRLAPGSIQTDGSAEFRRYFSTSDAGGMFLLRAVFPVSGPVDQVDSLEIDFINTAGPARTSRTNF